MQYRKNNSTNKGSAKEQVNKVFKELNCSTNKDSGRRTSPIRSNNSSVLGKSRKPVNIN